MPEAQYSKHKQEISRKVGQALRGSAAAYKKAGNAARARWSRPQGQRNSNVGDSQTIPIRAIHGGLAAWRDDKNAKEVVLELK